MSTEHSEKQGGNPQPQRKRKSEKEKPKLVSLTVHRNTLDRKRRHNSSKLLRQALKEINADKQMKGFILIGYCHKDGEVDARVFYHVEKPMDLYTLPSFCKQLLYESITAQVTQQTEEPPKA